MSNIVDDVKAKIRRSITSEFIRLEDDIDDIRTKRDVIVNKLMTSVNNLTLVDETGAPTGDTKAAVSMLSTALKALSDVESSQAKAVSLKLKQAEIEVASAAAAKDRIAVVLQATAPGQINQTFPHEELDATLNEMFGDSVKDFELKSNPRSLDETD